MSNKANKQAKLIVEQLENNAEFVEMITEAAKPENMSEPMTFEEFEQWLSLPQQH
jgi:hypothetical protein